MRQLASGAEFDKVIDQVRNSPDKINNALYDKYRNNLHKAVEQVLGGDDNYTDLYNRFKLNTSKFTAAKAFQATQMLKDADDNKAKLVLGTMERYQKTEYNTTIARARTGKQWGKFSEPARRRLYPNLKWIPSRSATKRDEHIRFYNKVWPKDDPFWTRNTPGALWGCKCDWTDTDEPPTGDADNTVAAKGLQGNPGITGQVFSDDASYYTSNSLKAIKDVEYKDAASNLRINVNAHDVEISDNIRTGRVLLSNFKEMELTIAGHFANQKNPEYLLNGAVADAKRVKSWNVASSFNSAKVQNADVVVIDLFNLENGNRINTKKLVTNIRNRHKDFTSGSVKSCYVTWKNKAVLIEGKLFEGINEQNKYILNEVLSELISQLL